LVCQKLSHRVQQADQQLLRARRQLWVERAFFLKLSGVMFLQLEITLHQLNQIIIYEKEYLKILFC